MERIKTEDSINIFEFVKDLRKQRVLMVQTSVSFLLQTQDCIKQFGSGTAILLGGNNHFCTFSSS